MKDLKFVKKILYAFNVVFALALLFSYLIPYISPESLPILAVLGLLVPFLIISNVFFLLLWIVKLKKYFFLSATVLLIGWLISTPFYRLSSKKIITDDDFKILSYNVRMFNIYKQIDKDSIGLKITNFVNKKNVDIVTFQEYHHSKNRKIDYPYYYFVPKSKKQNFGLAIYSKHKIINKGSLDFKNSANNAIFVDICKGKDTIRIYNLHLQSLKINVKKHNFGQKDSEAIIARLQKGFSQQAEQTNKLLAHEKKYRGKKIVCGDFNNTAYSWVYKEIVKGKQDSFLKVGNGFGRTFNFYFPMRIDFILPDNTAIVNYYKTFSLDYSDHYPILTHLNWKKK